MTSVATVLLTSFALVSGARAEWTYTKDDPHPNGAASVADLAQVFLEDQQEHYYVVAGADLHNLAPALINDRILLRGFVRKIDKFPVHKILVLSADGNYFVVVGFGETLGSAPPDLAEQLRKNGIRAAGGLLSRYEGDKVTLYCRIDQLVKEGGLTGNTLNRKCLIADPVDAWVAVGFEPRSDC